MKVMILGWISKERAKMLVFMIKYYQNIMIKGDSKKGVKIAIFLLHVTG